jgi:cytoplasmic iron level regulating protein YaaA (DUF328/UPF0246 family)
VLLLLPPSEAKTPGGDGPTLAELGATSDDALYAARLRLLRAVASFCRRTPAQARAALKLPLGSAATDLAANITARDAPTMPALERFSGVLFAALDVSSLTAAERRRAQQSTLVFSGAFGALGGDEPVPPHRVPASATLPRVGRVSAYWKRVLTVALAPRIEDEGLIVDLRSTDYAALWQPRPEQASRVVTIRVLEERGGRLQAVSWSAKHGKGLLARELLHTRPVGTIDDVAAAAVRIGYDARPRAAVGAGPSLDLLVPR